MEATYAVGKAYILSVPVDEPERLFGPDPSLLAGRFKDMAKAWHPDRNPSPSAPSVFAHLLALRRVAAERAARGGWRRPGVLELKGKDGRSFEMRYLAKRAFELGVVYVGHTAIAYALTPDNADLAARATAMVSAIRYPNAGAREAFERRLPQVVASVDTETHAVLVMRKEPDQVLLADAIAHLGGRIDPRHVAWMVSDLESVACFMDVAEVGLVHAGISPDTVLVSPYGHFTCLVGGWWYAARKGERLVAAPERTVVNVPAAILGDGTAKAPITHEMIRLTAAEALGHANVTLAGKDASLPAPFRRWLASPPPDTAIQDYGAWIAARDASFGPRKFVPMRVDPNAVYPQPKGT